ncbi:MAG: terminase family protein [Clostridia bacterium]|nr:terminase family protein [Clostridia bacterium]
MARARDKEALLREAEMLSGELERRHREDKLKYYRPHEKQLAFHRCMKNNRWALGGNRTGKTESGAAECAWLARGNHPYREVRGPMNGWVVSLTAEMQRDVAQKKLMSYLNPAWIKGIRMREGRADDPEGGIIDYIQVESVHGGVSTIGFKNCAQGREKFQGTSQDFIWFDEEPPEEIYLECLMRTLDNGGLIFGTMTPLKGMTWVYNTIYLNEADDPEVWYVTMSWEDNPHLSPEAVRQMKQALSEEELSSRKDGRFVSVSGLVYGEFDERVHVIDPFDIPREWQDMISIDPGMTKPLSCHWYAADHEGNVYVVAEHYRAGLSIEDHMEAIERISKGLEWKRDGSGRLTALMDAAADQHTLQAEKSVAELFREMGLNVNTRVNKSKWAGIQRVRQYLKKRPCFDRERWPEGKPGLFIFSTCPMMIREIKQYRWKADGEADEPVKKDDHAMDELRYYLMHRGEPAGSAAVLREGPILQHKKKLARRLNERRR